MSGNLERRYRRVLRVLPGWYRQQWEQDMVAAFLDSWLTGDPDADECPCSLAQVPAEHREHNVPIAIITRTAPLAVHTVGGAGGE